LFNAPISNRISISDSLTQSCSLLPRVQTLPLSASLISKAMAIL
jgi:hypothetical protein